MAELPLRHSRIIVSMLVMSLFLTLSVARTRIGTYWELPEAILPTIILLAVQYAAYRLLLMCKMEPRRALTTTLFLTLMFFSYHVFMDRTGMIMALCLWAAILITGLVLLRMVKPAREIFLSSIVAYALIFALLNAGLITYHYAGQRYDTKAIPQKADILAKAEVKLPQAPDIYFILQDAYASADTLQREFGYDNQPFIKTLKQQGFFVAEDSRSYYSQTMLSVSSTLNLNYFQDDVKLPHTGFSHRSPAAEYFLRPRLLENLRQAGYDMHMTSSGYDIDLGPGAAKTDIRGPYFEETVSAVLLRKTPVHHVLNIIFGSHRNILNPFRDHHDLIRSQYDFLREQAAIPGGDKPRFVYAHILLPHPPFVFAADGQLAPYNFSDTFSYTDGKIHRHSHLYEGGWAEYYKKGYAAQISYANKELEDFIRMIKQTPGTRPKVVIIQGDHGSRLKEDFDSLKDSDMTEIFGVMNAVYFSDGDYRGFSADTSPLNAMRLMANKYFAADLPLLANHQWFSTWKRPYDFIDVTDQAAGKE